VSSITPSVSCRSPRTKLTRNKYEIKADDGKDKAAQTLGKKGKLPDDDARFGAA